jgi:phospholipid-binding lipoprotein MlaA
MKPLAPTLRPLANGFRAGIQAAIKKIAAYALSVLMIGSFAAISGCATGPNIHPSDPIEPFNRSVARFNDGLDRAIVKPAATAYAAVTPSLMRAGVTNFFENLSDGWTTINGALQLRPQLTVESLMRFSVNTFFGLGGLLDIASEAGIEKHNEDLGKTLGRWGMPAGPYIVLPVFGPSTLRDALTISAEIAYDPVSRIKPRGASNATNALRLVNTRANFLRLGNVMDDAALDKYTFSRDAFLAKRRADVARSANKDLDDAKGTGKEERFDEEPKK